MIEMKATSKLRFTKHFIVGRRPAGISGGAVFAAIYGISYLMLSPRFLPNLQEFGAVSLAVVLAPFAIFGTVIGVSVGAVIGLILAGLAWHRSSRLMSIRSSVGLGVIICSIYPILLIIGYFAVGDLPSEELYDGLVGFPAAIVGGIVGGMIGWRYLSRRVGPALELLD